MSSKSALRVEVSGLLATSLITSDDMGVELSPREREDLHLTPDQANTHIKLMKGKDALFDESSLVKPYNC